MSDCTEDPYAALEAARNRSAERLRIYWTTGPGGVRIAWNSPGDWTRCVAELKRHSDMTDQQAKGYCSERHREMTGVWPGSRQNRDD